MSLPVSEASAKIRDGGPHGAAADVSWPVWAGVIPLGLRTGRPVAAQDYTGRARPPGIARLARD